VKEILDQEPRMLKLKSPIYVLGDIHGNFEDLSYFMQQLVLFGDFEFCPYSVLFLGDYVDRGIWSVECTALLLALKVMAPEKCFLLRGNHEFPEVNGDINRYGKGSFASQCVDLFGEKVGNAVWRKCNFAFKYMPLAATVDDKIFCTHGGIPRVVGDKDTRMEMLNSPLFPRFASTSCIRDDGDPMRMLLTDLMWSDPLEGENVSTDTWGFGTSTRGPLLSAFSNKAVEEFFKANNFELMIRAHEHKRVGLRLSNHRRVLTVFSSSAYCGTSFAGGLLYIDQNTIRIVTKEVTEASKFAYEHYDS
jgi:protein phosphatase